MQAAQMRRALRWWWPGGTPPPATILRGTVVRVRHLNTQYSHLCQRRKGMGVKRADQVEAIARYAMQKARIINNQPNTQVLRDNSS